MKRKLLIRLDDASPTMNRDKWERVINFLSSREVYPLVGVIPACKDPKMQFMPPEAYQTFWERMRIWQDKGCIMALHGYDHCYISPCSGINPVNNRSEFAGLPYELQADKLREGYNILRKEGLNIEWFFAPSHTYDENTIEALKKETPIRRISDTVALHPYKAYDLLFCPVQSGHFFNPRIKGTWTFCFHPSTMTERDMINFEQFIDKHRKRFAHFKEISATRKKTFIDKVLSWSYFLFRNIRAII